MMSWNRKTMGSTRKGAKTFGILERPSDAPVEREDFGAGKEMEVAGDAEERGDHAGGDRGRLDDRRRRSGAAAITAA